MIHRVKMPHDLKVSKVSLSKIKGFKEYKSHNNGPTPQKKNFQSG